MKRLESNAPQRSVAAKVCFHWSLCLLSETLFNIPSSLTKALIHRFIQGYGFAFGRFLRIESPRISMRWAL